MALVELDLAPPKRSDFAAPQIVATVFLMIFGLSFLSRSEQGLRTSRRHFTACLRAFASTRCM